MDSDEFIIPYSTNLGINYLIKFSPFDKSVLPDNINIEIKIIDIVIETDATPKEIRNNAGSLIKISKLINEYVDSNNGIYYCYCSDKPIERSKRKLHLTNQEYRSLLFLKMFEKENNNDLYINKRIIINDPQNGHHYIHLISKIENKKTVMLISEHLKKHNK